MAQSISFREAEEIIRRHGPEFGGRGVVGVGIADRNDRLRFVVAVEDVKTQERLARQYEDRDVSGYPVHVEIGKVQTIGGVFSPGGAVRTRLDLVQEIIDRPGIPLSVALAIAVAVIWFLSR